MSRHDLITRLSPVVAGAALALCACPGAARADDWLRLHLAGSAAFAGELELDSPAGRYAPAELGQSYGGYAGASYTLGRFMALEAGAALFGWRADGMSGRELAIDVLARPTVRFPVWRLELYAVLPIGLAAPVARNASADHLGVSGASVSAKRGWTVGGALGVHANLAAGFGARVELGVQKHWFGYRIDDVEPEIALDASFTQATLSLGMSYAVF